MNPMQMPQQAPAQGAGLGAMIQAKSAPGAGAPKQTMAQLMALAEKMPDSELADVLAGKSVRVPQFAAMLAAMGRESLRTAVAGAQAGQAKAPSQKDQMLAKMSGINALPAPNMEQLGEGMAAGGIVGYSGADGSYVYMGDPLAEISGMTPAALSADQARIEEIRKNETPAQREAREQAERDRAAMGSTVDKTIAAGKDVLTLPGRAIAGAAESVITRPLNAMGVPVPYLPESFYGGDRSSMTPFMDKLRKQAAEKAGREGSDFGMKDMDATAGTTSVAKPGTPPSPKASAPKGVPTGTTPGIAPPAAPSAPEARKSLLDDMDVGKDDDAKRIAQGKSQAQGEFLMQLGASLMGTPNLGQALQQGIQKGLPGLAASRKEANAILKDQREYQLNLAKAKEAAAQGKDDLAFKYAKLAEDSKYHAGIVAASMARASGGGDSRIATAAMNKAQEQLKLAMGDPRQKRALGTIEAQQTFLNNAFQSNLSILSGQGPIMPSIPTVNAPPQSAVVRE